MYLWCKKDNLPILEAKVLKRMCQPQKMSAKSYEKLTFLSPWYAHAHTCFYQR